MNMRGSNNNIRDQGYIGRGGWWGREQKLRSSSARNIMMQKMHQLINNGWSRSHLHHRLALCIIGFIALVHGKNGWIVEQAVSRGRVCITGAKKYYAVVWHFVYNIFICIYL